MIPEGIRRAALSIAYDNGMINRYESEGEFLRKIENVVKAHEKDYKLDEINKLLMVLTKEELEVVCNGDNDSSVAILARYEAPLDTEDFLDLLFES